MSGQDHLLTLYRLLDAERPPKEPGLRAEPPEQTQAKIVQCLRFDPASQEKFLLVGALGCGKSTELRAIAAALRADRAVIELDLDASGVDVTAASALDLLYLASLGALRHVREADRPELYAKLVHAYTGGDEPEALGTLAEALDGLAGFATTGGELVSTLGGVPGGGAAAGSAFSLAAIGVRLFKNASQVTEASSPLGRAIQDVARRISRAARAHTKRPLVVVIDGLEKMNGEAGERFLQVFQRTRLLADADWAAVIAAPPASMTVTNSVDAVGFRTLPIFGFGESGAGPELLVEALQRRFSAAEVPVDAEVLQVLRRIVRDSGGFPRHAVRMTRFAVEQAAARGRATIQAEDGAVGRLEVAKDLARTLVAEQWELLATVHRTHDLPESEEAAKLFAHARVLAVRPEGDQVRQRFVVHPLLRGELKPVRAKGSG